MQFFFNVFDISESIEITKREIEKKKKQKLFFIYLFIDE